MIVADTNILSTFARIGRLELLFAAAEAEALHLSPAVVKEIEVGLRKGHGFPQPIVDGLTGGAGFYALDLTAEEKSLADALPASLNAGERECIAVCAFLKAHLRTLGRRSSSPFSSRFSWGWRPFCAKITFCSEQAITNQAKS